MPSVSIRAQCNDMRWRVIMSCLMPFPLICDAMNCNDVYYLIFIAIPAMQWYGITCSISYPLPFLQRNATQWYATICIIADSCVCIACAWTGNHIESMRSESIHNETICEQMMIYGYFFKELLGRKKTSAQKTVFLQDLIFYTPGRGFWNINQQLFSGHPTGRFWASTCFFRPPLGWTRTLLILLRVI